MKRKTFKTLVFVKRTRAHSNGKIPIYVRITLDGVRTEFVTPHSVDPSKWDEVKGCVRGRDNEAESINSSLAQMQLKILELKTKMEYMDELSSPQQIRDKYLGQETNITNVLQLFIEHNKNCEKLKDIDFSSSTVSRYNTCMKHLANFIKYKYKKADFPLNDIRHQFVKDFEMYLKIERKCAHNSATKYLKNFKKIIIIALNNGYMQDNPFANIKFHLDEVDVSFLNSDELTRIREKSFAFERLDRVKDIYVFCCFTGLAFTDVKNLNEKSIEIIDGKKWIVIRRQKTKRLCQIPLLPPAEKILEKYASSPLRQVKGLLLPVTSNQKMNAYLKEIADICQIDKKLCTHTGRHTFATTVTLANDIPFEVVSKLLGHSSLTMTKRYARVTTDLIQKNMDKIQNLYS